MKLLLQKTIESLGRAGDVVEVTAGYARNYLLPQGLALEPTTGNLKRIEELKEIARKEEFKELQELQGKAQTLEGLEVMIEARCNEQGHLFGSVGPHDLSLALGKLGFDVPDKCIMLDPHIKQIDTYGIDVKLAEEAKANIKLWVVPDSESPPLEIAEQQDTEEPAGEADSEIDQQGQAQQADS